MSQRFCNGRVSARAIVLALCASLMAALLLWPEPTVKAGDPPDPLWAVEGRWVEPVCAPNHPTGEDCSDWSEFPHHAGFRPVDGAVLPNGTVFLRERGNVRQYVWNPTTGSFTQKPSNADGVKTRFCPGIGATPDGRMMIAGGTKTASDENNECPTPWAKWVGAYDWKSGTWKQLADLPSYAEDTEGAWYPTLTALPDGRILALGGRTSCGGCSGCNCSNPPLDPTIFDPEAGEEGEGAWLMWGSEETVACVFQSHLNYPFVFVIPDGRLFVAAGSNTKTFILDLVQEEWIATDQAPWVGHKASAVMYRPGKVLRSGGKAGGEVFERAATIDLSGPNPEQAQWQLLPEMIHPREAHDLIVLPNGHVIAVGGNEDLDDSAPVFHAEWIDLEAQDPEWQELADSVQPHIYHSVAILLPDARILAASGDRPKCHPSCCSENPPCDDPCCKQPCCTPPSCCEDDPPCDNPACEPCPDDPSCNPCGDPEGQCWDEECCNWKTTYGEIFEPPYLFAPDGSSAPRPVIQLAPARLLYDTKFCVALEDGDVSAEDIKQVNLIRTGAVTHGFDQNQRFVPLVDDPQTDIVVDSDNNRIQVTSPANPNIAPPGYYMLFLISDDGVPSVAGFVQVVEDCDCPADLDGNDEVDGGDLLILLSAWGECANPQDCPADLNGDGVVDGGDLLILLAAWGPCADCGGECVPQSMQECWDRYYPDMQRYETCVEAVQELESANVGN